jgi:hypothetical protein
VSDLIEMVITGVINEGQENIFYPNTVSEIITVSTGSVGNAVVKIFSLNGQEVYKANASSER